MHTTTLPHYTKLLPGESCEHCNLPAPDYPLCPACSKPMDDWPQNPKQFLFNHHWSFRDGWWYEPMSDCMGKASQAMIDGLKKRLKAHQEYLNYKSTQRDPMKLESALTGEAKLLKEIQQCESGPVQLREPAFYSMPDAIRRELNKRLVDKGVVEAEQQLDEKQQEQQFQLSKKLRQNMLKTGVYSIQEATDLSRLPAHKEQCGYCKRF